MHNSTFEEEANTSLERRLSANPKSPSFARLALHFLQKGNSERAVHLCLEGLKTFPSYSTGHLVLGKCYQSMGRNIEALMAYRRALRAVPDNPTVLSLLEAIEREEREAFRKFAEERSNKLKERKETLTLENYVSSDPDEETDSIELLIRRLKSAKKIVPKDGASSGEAGIQTEGGTKFVTATLAEIYANQLRYQEAIEAYHKLIDQNPQDAARYRKRITELQEFARVKESNSGE